MDALVKGSIGSAQSIERERAENVGGVDQRFCCEERQYANRQHRLRAVDQSNGFFCFEDYRFDLRSFESFDSRCAPIFMHGGALSHEDQREV